jgi:hypothetical protein
MTAPVSAFNVGAVGGVEILFAIPPDVHVPYPVESTGLPNRSYRENALPLTFATIYRFVFTCVIPTTPLNVTISPLEKVFVAVTTAGRAFVIPVIVACSVAQLAPVENGVTPLDDKYIGVNTPVAVVVCSAEPDGIPEYQTACVLAVPVVHVLKLTSWNLDGMKPKTIFVAVAVEVVVNVPNLYCIFYLLQALGG